MLEFVCDTKSMPDFKTREDNIVFYVDALICITICKVAGVDTEEIKFYQSWVKVTGHYYHIRGKKAKTKHVTTKHDRFQ